MILKTHSHLHQVPAPPLLPELRPGMDPTLLLLGQLCQGCACRLPALAKATGRRLSGLILGAPVLSPSLLPFL